MQVGWTGFGHHLFGAERVPYLSVVFSSCSPAFTLPSNVWSKIAALQVLMWPCVVQDANMGHQLAGGHSS